MDIAVKPDAAVPEVSAPANPRTRNHRIDLLKSIAIVCVIMIHAASVGFDRPAGSFDWHAGVALGLLSRIGVPVFLMCSGALFLASEKSLSLRKLYGKNLVRIVAAMLAWATGYKIYHIVKEGTFSFSSLYGGLKDVLLFRHEFHLYYLHIMILVYVLLPVTAVFVHNATKRQLEYLLVVWFALGILYPTVKGFPPFSSLSGIPSQWLMNQAYAAVGYGICGYYLNRYPLKRKICFALYFSGILIAFAGTRMMSFLTGSFYMGFFEGMSVGIAFMTVGVFGYFVSLPKELPPSLLRAVTYLSKASFCIYLSHVFFIYLFREFIFSALPLPYALLIPLTAAVYFVCGCAVHAVLSHIPLVNRWLI